MGIGYANNSDLTDLTSGFGEVYSDYLNSLVTGADYSESKEEAVFLWDVKGEARLLVSSFGLGFETGYYSTESKSKAESDYFNEKPEYKAEFEVIPYIVNLYYKHDLNRNSFFLFGFGVGKFNGKINLELDQDGLDVISGLPDFSRTFEGDAIGYQLKGELNLMFSESINVVAGMSVRHVEIDEFKDGDTVLINNDGSKVRAGLNGFDIYLGVGLML